MSTSSFFFRLRQGLTLAQIIERSSSVPAAWLLCAVAIQQQKVRFWLRIQSVG